MALNLQANTYAPEISMSGLTYHRNQDGIYIYKFDNFRREALDLWMEISQHNEKVAASQGDTTLLIIYDIRNTGTPTPYALAQGLRAVNEAPDEIYRISSVITEDGLSTQLINFFLHKLPRKVADALKIFSNDEEAIAWLYKTRADYLKDEPVQ